MIDHPVHIVPQIHCSRCDRPLIHPRKRTDNDADIAAGRSVLAECNACGVAVLVPAEMYQPHGHRSVSLTVARPWSHQKV